MAVALPCASLKMDTYTLATWSKHSDQGVQDRCASVLWAISPRHAPDLLRMASSSSSVVVSSDAAKST